MTDIISVWIIILWLVMGYYEIKETNTILCQQDSVEACDKYLKK